jgi:manganese-dependent ADP-ribose/CDP-alcohol diphosphatase
MGNSGISSDSEEETKEAPLVVFGVLSDIQYADVDDTSDLKSILTQRKRYYRNSLNLVSSAIRDWKSAELNENYKLSFILQLGDLVDGCCRRHGGSLHSMNVVLNRLNEMFTIDHHHTTTVDERDEEKQANNKQPRLMHVWGNHEFYNFKRANLVDSPLNTSKEFSKNFQIKSNNNNKNNATPEATTAAANYYSLKVTDRINLICLDMYEYSCLGYDSTDAIYQSAMSVLRAHRNQPNHDKQKQPQYRQCNGTISSRQFEWLRDELDSCNRQNKKAIVCGHIPLHTNASHKSAIAWNAQEILDLFWSFDDTVVAYLAGHYHPGGYFQDQHDIHHLTLCAILETIPSSNSYLTVKIYKQKVMFIGYGGIKSFKVCFD